MESAKQKFRSKHATLILKCYPRYTKHATTVQPNSSELNYLLYYASTRRSKLQKVGTFLQKKTAHDVSKSKLGNVQVTLQITNALIHKLPRDLPLYASYILDIFTYVLRSEDLTMVEESVPAFEAFCQHQDVATLVASQAYIDQFEQVVRLYASYAALKTPVQNKGGFDTPTAIRWRIACLKALKSVTASEVIGADGGRLMSVVMPVVLQNLHSGDPDHIIRVQQQASNEEGTDKPTRENARRRRMSVATARTSEKSRPTSAAVDGAVDDADLIAEEEVGLLAFHCLKQIFTVNNRTQIRLATDSVLNFICNEPPSKRPNTSRSGRSGSGATWSTTLIEYAAHWTQMQDRFVILTTTMEVLAKMPMTEINLVKHIQLLSLVDWLLRSNINMIGLSVMDLLLGLIQHMKSLLLLDYQTNELPTHPQTDAIDIFSNKDAPLSPPGSPAITEASMIEETPPSNSESLLVKIRRSIAALAMHVYYTDQVIDIVNAMLDRIRPFVKVASGVSSQKSDDSSEAFTSGTARVTALNTIKETLVVANTKGSVTGGAAIGRSRISRDSWQRTKWLIQDPDPRVRRAYVDTLLSWCRLERSEQDIIFLDEKHPDQTSLAELPHPRQSGFLPDQYQEMYQTALQLRQSDREVSRLEALIHYMENKKSESNTQSNTPPKPIVTENGTIPAIVHPGNNGIQPNINGHGHAENGLGRRLSIQTSGSHSPSRAPPARQTVRFERLRQIMYQERGASPGRTIDSNTQSIDFSYNSSRPSSTASRLESQQGEAKQEKQSEEKTIVTRPSTSSSREDPEVNALALRGARLSVDGEGGIPPVPPLPKGLQAAKAKEEDGIDVEMLLNSIVVEGRGKDRKSMKARS